MASSSPSYRRRRPEESVLYQVVRQHYRALLAVSEESGRPLPQFVRDELESYLRCGILAHGCMRVRCGECGYDRLVAFSCKKRGICGSCIARRMSETAAHLVDHVIPMVPMRQWVLTTPQPLRAMLAYDTKLCALVGRRFGEAIFSHLRQKVKQHLGLRSVRDIHPGAVTAVQRFNSAAQLSVHHHVLATDGAFVVEADGSPRFVALPPPSQAEVAQVAWSVCAEVTRELREQGRFVEDVTDEVGAEFAEREPGLAQCYAGSIRGTLVVGPNAGSRVVRLYGRAASSQRRPPGHGFDVHAGVRISADDRKGLERLCRYLIRPPLAKDRLERLPDGRIRVRLKRAWSDGTTHMVHDPLDFLTKLVALIPPPRAHRITYSGVFASRSKLRAQIAPKAPRPRPKRDGKDDCDASHTRRFGWAKLMARVFEIDVLHCPRCGAQGMQRIAAIMDRAVLRKLLRSVGLPADSPEPAPPRLPQQPELDFAS